jgi:hypothetical protein
MPPKPFHGCFRGGFPTDPPTFFLHPR